MSLYQVLRSKKSSSSEKLGFLLREIDLSLNEGIECDKLCRKSDAQNAYQQAIYLMDFALQHFEMKDEEELKLRKLIITYKQRWLGLDQMEEPKPKEDTELFKMPEKKKKNLKKKQGNLHNEPIAITATLRQDNIEEDKKAILDKQIQDILDCSNTKNFPPEDKAKFGIFLAQLIDQGKVIIAKPSSSEFNQKCEIPVGGNEETKDQAEIRAAIMSTLVKNPRKVEWNEVIGFDDVKKRLNMAVVAPVMYEKYWQINGMYSNGVLLFGPPGTGKTLLSLATATAAGNITYFSVKSSDLISKWQGQSERLVNCLFEVANEMKPSIIFIGKKFSFIKVS